MRVDLPLPDLLAALVAGGAVVLGVGVGVALLTRRAGSLARTFLGLFLIGTALSVLHEIVGALDLHRLNDHLWITPLLYTFALGPLLAGFVKARVEPEWRPGWSLWPHAVLPAWQVVHELATGFAPLSVKSWFWQTPYARAYGSVDTLIFVASFAAYLLVAQRVVRQADKGDAAWLGRLIRGAAVILGVAVTIEVLYAVADLGAGFDWLELGALVAYAALLYWTAVTGWVHVIAPSAQAERQETYGITDRALAAHVATLQAHVANARPYLAPDLTQPTLAAQVGLSDKELSYVLNAGLETGYSDYVNRLRVAEAQRRLEDPACAHAPVLELGLASGFASKATFNRVFKRETGQTPSSYRAGRLTTP